MSLDNALAWWFHSRLAYKRRIACRHPGTSCSRETNDVNSHRKCTGTLIQESSHHRALVFESRPYQVYVCQGTLMHSNILVGMSRSPQSYLYSFRVLTILANQDMGHGQ
jgi:hypothetical protein